MVLKDRENDEKHQGEYHVNNEDLQAGKGQASMSLLMHV